jgi:hypothetical protein
MLSQLSDNSGEPKCGKNVSKLEKDVLLTFKVQEDLSSAHSPNSVYPYHLSPKPAQPEMGQDPGQSGSSSTGLEELDYNSLLQSQP